MESDWDVGSDCGAGSACGWETIVAELEGELPAGSDTEELDTEFPADASPLKGEKPFQATDPFKYNCTKSYEVYCQ